MSSDGSNIIEQRRYRMPERRVGWRVMVYTALITLLLVIAQSMAVRAASRTDVAWIANPIASGIAVSADAHLQPPLDWEPENAYTGPPLIMIWPSSGTPDTLIELTGYGFAPRIAVRIYAGREGIPENVLIADARTSVQGTLREVVMLPERATPGEQWHVAVSPVGSIFKAVSNVITVVAPQSASAAVPIIVPVVVPTTTASVTEPNLTEPIVITPIVVTTPIGIPTEVPTAIPTVLPTEVPTIVPTVIPTAIPTIIPTVTPTAVPTAIPTIIPTAVPTEPPTAVPTIAPAVQPAANWAAMFYNNPTLAGQPVTIAQVPEVNFDWGDAAPVPQLPPDDFSARFEQNVDLPAGFYTLSAQADDGVRVFVNDELVIDEWHLGEPPVYRVGRQLSGPTTFRVEYYEAGGGANLRFNYELVDEFPDWQATFYNNIDLSGEPVWVRAEGTGVDAELSHQWSLGSPVEGVVPPDNWSGRWTGTFEFEAGDYAFRADANDGVRVWLDDVLIINEWTDEESQAEVVFQDVTVGDHTVTVEYYERGGIANLRVWWDRFIP